MGKISIFSIDCFGRYFFGVFWGAGIDLGTGKKYE